MTSIALWIVITVVLFLIFCTLILLGIRRKRMKFIYGAVAFFLFTVVSAIYTGALTTYKAYQAVRGSDVRNPFDKRTGMEIYTDLFGVPQASCVVVTNSKDQKITDLDFSLWLKFQTCGSELKRIILEKDFEPIGSYKFSEDIPRPGWFNPGLLGDSSTVMGRVMHEDLGASQSRLLFFSNDSTQAYYCDLEEK